MKRSEMFEKIDHIGIAVRSVAEVKKLFKTVFRLEPVFEELIEDQKVKVVGFKIGESKLEFLEPTEPSSPIMKFLEKRGEGIHHFALEVDDIQSVMSDMKSHNLQLIDEKPREGAEGKHIAFVHPKSMHGILLELSQEKSDIKENEIS